MQNMPDIALVPIDSDLDVTTVRAVRRTVDRLIDGGCRRIILNMLGASYVDSAGMALIFRSIRRMRAMGGLVSITNASERVLRSLRIARVVDFAPVSGRGPRPVVSELDPKVQPLWRVAVRIDPTDLAETRTRVGGLLRRLPFTDDQMFDMTLAVGEAMGNAVDHTDGSCAQVTVSAFPDRAVIDVTDCGCGYAAPPRMPTSVTGQGPLAGQGPFPEQDSFAERGRGVRMMRLLADSVTITPKPSGVGTLVRLVKLVEEADVARS